TVIFRCAGDLGELAVNDTANFTIGGRFGTRVALTFQTIFQINNLLNLQIIGWFSCTKIKKSPNVELIQRLSINLSTKGDFYG
ncbi:hypothetical protein ELR41_21720, partial [Shigella sonnei]|nr:hypothetical protein [Shigella sonnei]